MMMILEIRTCTTCQCTVDDWNNTDKFGSVDAANDSTDNVNKTLEI